MKPLFFIFTFAFLLFTFFLSPFASLAQETYLIGGIEIRLYETRQELFADLPAEVQATQQAIRQAVPGAAINGWASGSLRRVYAVKDWCVVFHELKHILEPDWLHELDRNDACKEVRIK